LMGGALIVISSGDHQSNNTSDQYQQTFYVAEHACRTNPVDTYASVVRLESGKTSSISMGFGIIRVLDA